MLSLPLGTVLRERRRRLLLQLCPQLSLVHRCDAASPSDNRPASDITGLAPSLLIAFNTPRTDAEDASGLRLRHPLVDGAKQMGPEVV
jgi:hypothetical protein